MRVLWINRSGSLHGGGEQAMRASVRALSKSYDMEPILLYELGSLVDRSLSNEFAAAFPIADLTAQIDALEPDTIFVHRAREEWLDAIATRDDIRRIAFVHDHDMLCLRRHKRALLEMKPCERRSGAACALRCGPLARGVSRLELRSPNRLAKTQRILAKLDAVIAPSRYMARQLEEIGIARENVHRVAPLVELPEVRNQRSIVRGRLLFVGAMTTGKGAMQLVEALALLDASVTLTLIGDGPQRATIAERARTLGVGKRVQFLGQVAREVVMSELRAAEIFVAPAVAPESFGLSGVEALAAGVGVVGTGAGGTRDWLEHGMTGLVSEPGDVVGLARALSEALAQPEEMQTMAIRGRERVTALLNQESHVRALAGLLGLRRSSNVRAA